MAWLQNATNMRLKQLLTAYSCTLCELYCIITLLKSLYGCVTSVTVQEGQAFGEPCAWCVMAQQRMSGGGLQSVIPSVQPQWLLSLGHLMLMLWLMHMLRPLASFVASASGCSTISSGGCCCVHDQALSAWQANLFISQWCTHAQPCALGSLL